VRTAANGKTPRDESSLSLPGDNCRKPTDRPHTFSLEKAYKSRAFSWTFDAFSAAGRAREKVKLK
jgi:hypothetical protein